jgi:hypothetical protein
MGLWAWFYKTIFSQRILQSSHQYSLALCGYHMVLLVTLKFSSTFSHSLTLAGEACASTLPAPPPFPASVSFLRGSTPPQFVLSLRRTPMPPQRRVFTFRNPPNTPVAFFTSVRSFGAPRTTLSLARTFPTAFPLRRGFAA